MRNSWVIRRLGETEIRIHFTILLVLLFALPRDQPLTAKTFLWSIALTIGVFMCITLHELMHTLVARLYKIPVTSITLWPLGGVAQMAREPSEPLSALLIAAAGPLTNIMLAVALAGAAAFGSAVSPEGLTGMIITSPNANWVELYLVYMMLTNLSLGLFNLIPLYPLDGGRILHAVLHGIFGQERANRAMFFISLILAALMAVFALVRADYVLLVIAVFLGLGAASLTLSAPKSPAEPAPAIVDRSQPSLKNGFYNEVIDFSTSSLNLKPHQTGDLPPKYIPVTMLD